MTPILQGSFEIGGPGFGGTVTYGGGPQDWEIDGSYADFIKLAADIEGALDTAIGGAGTWTVSVLDNGSSGFRIERADSAAFDLTVDKPLQEFCNLSASYTSETQIDSSATPPFFLAPDSPLELPDCWYEYMRHQSISDEGSVLAVQYGATRQYFTGTAICIQQQAQVEAFLLRARRGVRFRLYHDYPTDKTAWTESNRDGFLDLVLADPSTSEEWASEPATVVQRVPLDCRVITA